MGIRFLCPNGHKLNVKSFLAGKRGICPHCGVKVDIPDDSQAQPAAPISTTENTAPAAAVTTSSTTQKKEAAPETSLAVPMGTAPDAASGATSAPTAPVATTPVQRDPLNEVPGAKWYVRPVSGGQYGPAEADVFRGWIDQGRVTADSLVWRDGWAEWQPASTLLAQMNAQATPPASGPITPTTPTASAVPVAPAAPTAATQNNETPQVGSGSGPRPRRRSNSAALALFIILVISSIGLIGLLIAVIYTMSS